MILPHPSIPLLSDGQHINEAWYRNLSNALVWSKAPAAHNSNGIQGQIAYDANFLYVCIAKNTWVRVALASW